MKKLLLSLLLLTLLPSIAVADRLWTSGFELNTNTNAVEFEQNSNTTNMTVQSTIKRSGGYAARFLKTTTGATGYWEMRTTGGNVDACPSTWVYLVTSMSTLTPIMFGVDNTATDKWSIKLATNDTLELWEQVGTPAKIGSSSSAISKNTWTKVSLCSFYTSGTVTAKLNNSQFASGTSVATTPDSLIRFGVGADAATAATGDIYFDDIIVNNSNGSVQNSYGGDDIVCHLHPNANGDNSMGSRGGADSGSNWGQVAEVTPNDATNFWNLGTNNDILDVNIEAASVCGITTGDTINVVQVGIREALGLAATNVWNVRIKSQASGTVLAGTSTTHNDSTYRTNGDNVPRNYTLTSYVDPQAGGAWTAALLDTSQIGVKITTLGTGERVTTLWLLVSYEPAGAATPTPTATATATATSTATATPTATATATATPTATATFTPTATATPTATPTIRHDLPSTGAGQ